MEERSKRLEMGRRSLIDISSEDDSLFLPSPPLDLQDSQSSETCNEHNFFGVVEGESDQRGVNVMECAPAFTEPSNARARKVGKCNLRKSLAWDSAFFTSEGVLDPDELAIVNKPLKKTVGHALPGIQEDIRKSAESTSTLGSDGWALECVEVDLFEDIRASIQKAGHECDKASDVTSSINKAGQRESSTPYLSSSQKVELASRNLMKPVSKLVSTSKRQSISKHEAEKKVKEALICPRAGVTRKAGHNLSLKPPKILSSANPLSVVPTKRIVAAPDAGKVKNNTAKVCGNVGNQRPAVSKKPISGDSRRVTPSTLPSPKSSSDSTCSTKIRPTISGSSFNSSGSTSSGSRGKSAPTNLRNKTLSRNADQSSTDSTIKTPLCNLRNKTESRNSHLSAYVMCTSKFASSVSPASSIDGLSSASSSSIYSGSQRLNSSKASLDVISLDSLESDAPQSPDSQKNVHDQPHVGDGDSGKGLLNQGVEKDSMEIGSLSHPPAAAAPKSSFVRNTGLRCKPSGLRMPSPKIGFFDAETSAGLTSNGCLQSHSGMQIGLLKKASVSGNLDGAFKQKSYNFQSTRSLTQTGLAKFNSNNIGSPRYAAAFSMKPTSTHLQQLPTPTTELFGTSGTTEDDPNMFVKDRHEQSQIKRNEDKILVSEDALDGLSRHVEGVNFNTDTAKDLKEVKGSSLAPFGVQSSDTSSDMLSSSLSGELVCDRKVDFLRSMTNPSVSISPTKVEIKPSARTPLAVNCSFGNTSISHNDPMVEPTTEKATDKTSVSPFLDKAMHTFTPDTLPVPAVELGQENIIANSFSEKWVPGNQENNPE